jgi:hypothetical protein
MGNWGGLDTPQATSTFYQAPGVGYLNNLFIQSSCQSFDILNGPYAPPIGCGTVDFAVPAASVWNSAVNGYCCAGPGLFEIDGTAVLAAPEPSAWMLVLAAALVTLVAKWKTLIH